MTDIAAATAERLRAFSTDLDPNIIEYVAYNTARHVGDLNQGALEIAGQVQTIPHEGPVPLQVLDMVPDGEYDERSVVVVGLMWGQGLTPWVARRLALLRDCMPNDRIVALATPAGSSPRWGSLSPAQLTALKRGNFSPLVDPLLEYLQSTGVQHADLVGTSFGADELAAATAKAADYDIKVNRFLAIEPTSILVRHVGRLVVDFCATRYSVAPHVGVSGSASYDRLQRAEFTLSNLAALAVHSLLRSTSRAAAAYLAGGQFGRQLKAGLASQKDTLAQIVWGTASELAPYTHAQRLVQTIQEEHGERVSVLWMPELGHGLCSDVALTTVLTLQGLGRTLGVR